MSAIHLAMREPPPRYHVYALLCQDKDGPGYVKFGMSKNIGARLDQLRQGCPVPARYFATVAVGRSSKRTREIERALHDKFSHRKIRAQGEWFRFDFYDVGDKKEFNEGCKLVFAAYFGIDNCPWWEKVSVAAIEKHARQVRAQFMNSKHRPKILARAKAEDERRKAWKELG